MPNIITAKNLTIAFGKNKVIDSANFTIADGDFVCVVGANGSGKSTLIKSILNIIKINRGKIIYGKDITNTTIGYLPQESKVDQNFPTTVFEIVLSGTLGRLKFRPFYRKADKELAEKALDTLKISHLKDKSFADLSGGQKQKVLLARALTATSKVLILDEPSNHLDHNSKTDFYDTLKEINQDLNITIIMITHDLDADDLIGNKILAIENGRVKIHSTADFLRSYR